MKIAALSDIHGNLPALEAVLEDLETWQPDAVIMNGDLVSRGPYSKACWERLENCFPQVHYLKGNHEAYVSQGLDTVPDDPKDPRWELSRFARWTAQQLGPERVAALRRWPDQLEWVGARDRHFSATHGSRQGNRVGISASTPEAELPARVGAPGGLFLAAHTHKPLVRPYGDTLIVNSGSVGTPLDGDVRAAYAQIRWHRGRWQARIRRIAYDRCQTERDFWESGFLEAGGPFARIILAEFREARVLAGSWMRRFYAPVLARELSVADAVAQHLEEAGIADL